MDNLEISMIHVRAGLLQSGCSPARTQVAVNPGRPIDLKPARRHDDPGALD